MSFERARAAADAIAAATGVDRHEVAVVLGSGLGGLLAAAVTTTVSYRDLPGFPVPTAAGHGGLLHSAVIGEARVLVLSGRAHFYEGWDHHEVVLPVRAAVLAGCGVVVLTNAAGGIAPALAPGDLAVVSDHINLAARNPLVGPNDERLGPRFPDLTDAYSGRLREIAHRVAGGMGMSLPEVVYAWWLGPAFETPAEIRMLAALGADVVGMSTVPEVIAARHMGAEVVAFSLVTNRAAGLGPGRLLAEEVMEAAGRARPWVDEFLTRLIAEIG